MRSGQPAPSWEGGARRRGPVPETSRRRCDLELRGDRAEAQAVGEPPSAPLAMPGIPARPGLAQEPGSVFLDAEASDVGEQHDQGGQPQQHGGGREPADPHGLGPSLQLLVPCVHRREVPLEVTTELERVCAKGQPLHLGAVLGLGEHARTPSRVELEAWVMGRRARMTAVRPGGSGLHGATVHPTGPDRQGLTVPRPGLDLRRCTVTRRRTRRSGRRPSTRPPSRAASAG